MPVSIPIAYDRGKPLLPSGTRNAFEKWPRRAPRFPTSIYDAVAHSEHLLQSRSTQPPGLGHVAQAIIKELSPNRTCPLCTAPHHAPPYHVSPMSLQGKMQLRWTPPVQFNMETNAGATCRE